MTFSYPRSFTSFRMTGLHLFYLYHPFFPDMSQATLILHFAIHLRMYRKILFVVMPHSTTDALTLPIFSTPNM